MTRKTVSVDFDGVLHRYETPWIAPHKIPDPPVDGAIEWLSRTLQHFDVVVHSTRCQTWRGQRAIQKWLRKHSSNLWHESMGHRGIEEVGFSYKKVPALIYIDDRAWRFAGVFPTRNEIHMAKPWNKKP